MLLLMFGKQEVIEKKSLSNNSKRSYSNRPLYVCIWDRQTLLELSMISMIYLQLDRKKPIFLDILTSKKLQITQLVRQQEFCPILCLQIVKQLVNVPPIDEVLNLSDNIFVHLLCWKYGFHNQRIFDCGIRYVQEF